MDTKLSVLGDENIVLLRLCFVQFTMFCECVRFHEICSTLRILTQNFSCSLKLVSRRLRLVCCALYQVSWNTI